MKAKLAPVGNSIGIRIPRAVLRQTGMSDAVELTVSRGNIIISPLRRPREGWEESFTLPAGKQELLVPSDIRNRFDEEEWEW